MSLTCQYLWLENSLEKQDIHNDQICLVKEVILPRLQQFAPPQDGINPKNLSIIFSEDLETTIKELKEYMQELLL